MPVIDDFTIPSWKIIVNESSPFMTYLGVKVFNTNHSLERTKQRYPEMTEEDFKILFKRGIEAIKDTKTQNEYLIYSKSYDMAYVVAYRKDKFSNDSKNHMFLITILPKGKKNPKDGTNVLVVEGHLESYLNMDVLDYFCRLIYPGEIISEAEYQSVLIENIKVLFCDGKVYDCDVDCLSIE